MVPLLAMLGLLVSVGSSEPARRVLLFDTLADPAKFGEQALGAGARPLLVVYEVYPGADPHAREQGSIDIPSLLRHIERVSGGSPPEWGLLDFEDPFMEWAESGPGGERWTKAIGQMVDAIKAVKRAFPKTKWGFYQVPYVRYWIEGKSWADASREVQDRAALKYLSQWQPVIDQSDWLCPSLYCLYDPAASSSADGAKVRDAGRAWSRAQVEISFRAAGTRPVIPIISPIWQVNGNASVGAPVPIDQLRGDVIEPALRAGAGGFVIWTSFDHYINCAVSGKPASPPQFDRSSFVKHYLDGVEPRDWSDPTVSATLRARSGRVVLNAILAVRESEQSLKSGSPSP
jgi:hypothetical protein